MYIYICKYKYVYIYQYIYVYICIYVFFLRPFVTCVAAQALNSKIAASSQRNPCRNEQCMWSLSSLYKQQGRLHQVSDPL